MTNDENRNIGCLVLVFVLVLMLIGYLGDRDERRISILEKRVNQLERSR